MENIRHFFILIFHIQIFLILSLVNKTIIFKVVPKSGDFGEWVVFFKVQKYHF